MRKQTRTKRIALFGSITTLSVSFLISILVLTNYLAYRHYWRTDLTNSKVYSLSPVTVSHLNTLQDDITIYVFYPKTSELFPYIEFIVDEFQRLSKHITSLIVDVDHDLLKTQEYKQKFKLSNENYIVVEHQDKFRVLVNEDLAEYDIENSFYGQDPVLKCFTGEDAIFTAIQAVISKKQTTVYFTAGHGEKDTTDHTTETGYAEALNRLRYNNITVNTLVLAQSEVLPDDADLIVIGGPEKPFSEHELQLLKNAFDSGTPILVLLDPGITSGMESFLAEYGCIVHDSIIIDPQQHVPFASPAYIISNILPGHAVTRTMTNMMGIFYGARSIAFSDKDLFTKTPLVQTSNEGWGETTVTQDQPKKDDNDITGPVIVAGAMESDADNKRLVVFGDSDFIGNTQILNMANADLFINSVNWLLNQMSTPAINPKLFNKQSVTLSSKELSSLSLIVMLIMPGIIFSTGLAIWKVRRK
ncbi:MAG: hypothetical protein C4541_06695 [Candidatus Auribacter fodinae]|jgi:ABC-type uncharacterized transport system involved in gliding motility auxiliary subunit|uniref:Uncharacterized protein n=1 Tax=Candidatus Auribacter fodinae TaxID=2093366 RepID=A0A3A4R2G1_9BACT|nr:MAG: hypothetical protein C4541_06695 [Candidatus Auribacter fodinae]